MSEKNHDEISLADIIQFVKESYQLLIGFTLIGLVCGIMFLFVTPKQYEASVQIQLPQMAAIASSTLSIIPFQLTNIVPTDLLIAKLQISNEYPPEAFEACDINEKHKTISSIVQVKQKRGIDNLVELKIRRTSKETASKCAEVIFSYIKNLEEELRNQNPFIRNVRQRIEQYTQEIQALEKETIRYDGSRRVMLVDLSTTIELNALRRDQRLLNQFIKVSGMYPTKLFSPIVVSDSYVSPNKMMVLLVGLFGGVFCGFLWVHFRKVMRSYRENPNGIS